MNQPLDPSETLPFDPKTPMSEEAQGGRSYLLIVQGATSRRFELPDKGMVTVGRDGHADLDLNDGSTSRKHAGIEIDSDGLRISDLGSRNGTRVNGELVRLPRELFTGDIITICSVTLIVHRAVAAPRRSVFGDLRQLRERLDIDLARARRFRHALTVLDLDLAGDIRQRQPIEAAIASLCESIDFAAWVSESQVVVLLPGQSSEDARLLAHRAFTALSAVATSVRAGYATYPDDAVEASVLLGASRAAAQKALPGAVCAAANAFDTYDLGNRKAIVADPSMQEIYRLIMRLAKADVPVLILGQRGTGKELVALALHHYSPQRKSGPFLALNGAAIPEGTADSELFGHKKGSFSMAFVDRPGVFEAAAGGTVFVDEVGELPVDLQAKILRTLQEHTVRRVGENHDRPVDARIVAATNRSIDDAQNAGFRRDLYDRLGVTQVLLPPLRERKRELPILARAFLQSACRKVHRADLSLSHGAYERLHSHAWPGSVRELENVMTRLAILVEDETKMIDVSHLDQALGMGSTSAPIGERSTAATASIAAEGLPLNPQRTNEGPQEETIGNFKDMVRDFEIKLMVAALRATKGVISRAAKLIEMPERTFFKKLNDYTINISALLPDDDGSSNLGEGETHGRPRKKAQRQGPSAVSEP